MTIGSGSGARALLASVGLMADGPVMWGRPISAKGPGLYAVELPAPVPAPPIELTRVGKWIERVPSLRLDGERPTSKALVARLASYWLPSTPVLYVGATGGSVGGRVIALAHHVLGDRRPHADGHWLFTLRGLEQARIWWAETDAPEEYLDAVLDAFAASIGEPPSERPAGSLLIPWANGRRPTGERQPHGIGGSVLPDDGAAAKPAEPRVVELPPGDADGAAAEARGTGSTRREGDPASIRPRAGTPAARAAAPTPSPRPRIQKAPGTPSRTPRASSTERTAAAPAPRTAAASRTQAPEPVHMSADALERMRGELDELTRLRRPDVVARIKAARELGDLRENAEYQAAREEQSFLEGRVRMLEERIRNAVVIEARGEERVHLGSVVTVVGLGVVDDEPVTYTIVGSTEADPAAGRISAASPVGAALLGAVPGDEVEVRTPRGIARYRVERIG
jgi:transcription elongation factor GreA